MPAACTFTLNNQSSSVLQCPGVGTLVAFSGHGVGRNNPAVTDQENIGPIPKGRYYIVDRQSGGHLGRLYDLWGEFGVGTTDHTQWFMLWNSSTGDSTYVGKVKRGAFRLHPVGQLGLSNGCITVINPAQFKSFAGQLRKNGPDLPVPGTNFKAYGTVDVQ